MPSPLNPLWPVFVSFWFSMTETEQQAWNDKADELQIGHTGIFLFVWQCYAQDCTAETLPPDINNIQLIDEVKPKQEPTRPPAN